MRLLLLLLFIVNEVTYHPFYSIYVFMVTTNILQSYIKVGCGTGFGWIAKNKINHNHLASRRIGTFVHHPTNNKCHHYNRNIDGSVILRKMTLLPNHGVDDDEIEGHQSKWRSLLNTDAATPL